MGIECYKYVWKNYKKQGGHKLVMLALAEYANDDTGECWPSISTLAEMVCVSDRQVQKILADLKRTGDIEIEEARGRNHTNRYRINKKGEPHDTFCGQKGESGDTFQGDKGEPHDTFNDDKKVNYSTEKVNSSAEKVNYSTQKGELQFTRSTIEPLIDPSKNQGIARANGRNPTAPAVVASESPPQSTGDPFMDAARAKFERSQNGNGNRGYAQDWQIELNRRMPARERVVIVDLVARLFGLTAKMNSDDKTLKMVHEQAVVLADTGHDTPEKVEALHAVWMADDWRKNNPDKLTVYKFTDFASLKAEEAKAKAAPKTKKAVTFFNQYSGKTETVVYQ